MIVQYLGTRQKEWDTLLPEFSLAINTSVSDTTGYSPAFLVQGREPRLPGALYEKVTPTPTAEERDKPLRDVFMTVQANARNAAAEQGRHYNMRRRPRWPT